MTLTKPTDFAPPVREAGGDNEVPRDGLGRPRIVVPCWSGCEGTGKVASEKTGKPIKCQPCKGQGKREKSYTRTTTYIDVIEDKSNLETWQMRMVLVGVDKDRGLLDGVEDLYERFLQAERVGDDEEKKKVKDELNRRAQTAKKLAGAEDKADKGTHLHGLSEQVDLDQNLPVEISFEDVIDMDAYRRATTFFHIVHMEKLVVHDEYAIGGTPDRVSRIDVALLAALLRAGRLPDGLVEVVEGVPHLKAPDGALIGPDDLLITDLKTGSVEYGGLKMAMQLSIYSRSELYDHTTGERESMGPVRTDWGIIMHVPAGTGTCTLYWADLNLGWEAVEVAKQVRALRSRSGKALQVLVRETTPTETVTPAA